MHTPRAGGAADALYGPCVSHVHTCTRTRTHPPSPRRPPPPSMTCASTWTPPCWPAAPPRRAPSWWQTSSASCDSARCLPSRPPGIAGPASVCCGPLRWGRHPLGLPSRAQVPPAFTCAAVPRWQPVPGPAALLHNARLFGPNPKTRPDLPRVLSTLPACLPFSGTGSTPPSDGCDSSTQAACRLA